MATLLVITVFLPLFGGLAVGLWPGLDARRARAIALGTALVAMAFALVLLANFQAHVEGPQFAFVDANGHYGTSWAGNAPGSFARPDIRFALGLDGLSLWLFVLTALLSITAVCASWESIKERAPAHYAFLLALETGLLGLFASLDVVLFYVFFEFTLVPLFFLIGIWGGPERRRASVTFFLYTLAGSLLTLLGVIALVVVHSQFSEGNVLTFSMPDLTRGLAELNWDQWHEATSWSSPQVVIFLLLLAGFAIKVPMFPFHTWLPLAHVEAPTAGSIILAGVLLKVGSYGLLRFNMMMVPLAAEWLFPLLATLAVTGIIYGALAALAQTDIKRLVAYSSVSHMGFIVLGTFALNQTGMDGAVVQMLNHGLTTGALFACVGIVYERYHTRSMAKMSGLWARLPLLAFFFILAAMGSAALPGLNGYVGELPILVGAYQVSPLAAVLAATGIVLGAYYVLLMVREIIFGPLKEPAEHTGDASTADHGPGAEHEQHAVRPVGWHEIVGLAPIMFLIVAIGIVPSPIFDQIQPVTQQIARNYQLQRQRANDAARSRAQARAARPTGGGPAPGKTAKPAANTRAANTRAANTRAANTRAANERLATSWGLEAAPRSHGTTSQKGH